MANICINTQHVIEQRNNLMRHFLNKGAKYLGKVDRSHFNKKELENLDKRKTGRELDVEFIIIDFDYFVGLLAIYRYILFFI